jgi:hypothetical protein
MGQLQAWQAKNYPSREKKKPSVDGGRWLLGRMKTG